MAPLTNTTHECGGGKGPTIPTPGILGNLAGRWRDEWSRGFIWNIETSPSLADEHSPHTYCTAETRTKNSCDGTSTQGRTPCTSLSSWTGNIISREKGKALFLNCSLLLAPAIQSIHTSPLLSFLVFSLSPLSSLPCLLSPPSEQAG